MISSQSRKYDILKNILDRYVEDGSKISNRKSYFDTGTEDKKNQARSRAFIHLYLASTYGILDFEEREKMITDAGYDGGVDAYYIDSERKIIDVIQAKFRANPSNFELKNINPEEIAAIDLHRIMSGNTDNEKGVKYNGYIQAFIEKIQKIPDIARYKSKVTILANVKQEHHNLVKKLFYGDEVNIVDFRRCYGELVLPTLRGEQHYSSSMRLQMDLSNKSNNSRLTADIETAYGTSTLSVVLIPTIEIATILSKYKNSLLRYNPRSYLEFKEQRTNEGIRRSIEDLSTGEFAILNNGITIISDDTYISERTGTKGRAHIEIVNPQIINGGQTAFTLSKILEKRSSSEAESIFDGKEVTVRIITLPPTSESKRIELIKSISSATNSQTEVSATDRSASNDENRELAELVFKETGLLYEPKRGEYHDAIEKKLISKSEVIDRTLFTRLIYVSSGDYKSGVSRRLMRNTGGIIPKVDDVGVVNKFKNLFEIFEIVSKNNNNANQERAIEDIALSIFALSLIDARGIPGGDTRISHAAAEAKEEWELFKKWARRNLSQYGKGKFNKKVGEIRTVFRWIDCIRSADFPAHAATYVRTEMKSQ